jgi:hypothetical protein
MKLFTDVYESGFLEIQEKEIQQNDYLTRKNAFVPDFSETFGKPAKHFTNIIISDIHLGSSLSQTDLLIFFLKNISFDKLIINGDIFDSIKSKYYPQNFP